MPATWNTAAYRFVRKKHLGEFGENRIEFVFNGHCSVSTDIHQLVNDQAIRATLAAQHPELPLACAIYGAEDAQGYAVIYELNRRFHVAVIFHDDGSRTPCRDEQRLIMQDQIPTADYGTVFRTAPLRDREARLLI